jgi:hypothetical protein
VLDKAGVGDLNKSTNQPFNQLTIPKGGDLMPGFDRTGPKGAGAMTGGRRGLCNPATAAGTRAFIGNYGYGCGPGLRRGFRGGSGRGRRPGFGREWCPGFGRGYGWYPPVAGPVYAADTAGELEVLRNEADYLKSSMDAVNKRIEELEKNQADES